MNTLRNEFKIIIPIFIGSLLLFLLTANHCLTLVLDSACYIADIARSDYVFFPHHLFYHVSFYHWNSLLNTIGFHDVISNLDALNSIFGSISVVIIYLILHIRLNISRVNSIIFTILPSFSFGFWIVSTSVNVYAVSLFCQLLIFYIYLKKDETWRKWILIGLIHGIAIVFNQWNIFIFLVVTLSCILSEQRKLIFKKYYWVYVFSSGIVSIGSYLTVMTVNFKLYIFKGMLAWLTYYGSEFEWTTSISKAVRESIIGIGQTIVAPYWLFSFQWFSEMVKGSLASNVSFLEEAFFASSIPFTISVILTILAILLVIGLLILIIISIANMKLLFSQKRKEFIYLFSWILLPSIMPFFWSGYNQRYWFIQTTAFFIFIVLSTVVISTLKNKTIYTKIVYFLAAIIFIVNFFGVFLYSSDNSRDLTYNGFIEIEKKTKPGDILIYRNLWTLTFYNDIYSGKLSAMSLHNFQLRDKEKLKNIILQLKEFEKKNEYHTIIITNDVLESMNDYPTELKKYLEDFWKRNNSKMKIYKTKYINFYILHPFKH